MSADTIKPIETFICYEASDKPYYEQLLVALAPLQQQGLLDIKHSREIGLLAPWRKQVHPGIYSARLIILLISQSFISSGYDRDQEMLQALQKHECKETRIVPILFRPTSWISTPLHYLPFLFEQKQPISKWKNQVEAFEEIKQKIGQLCKELQKVPIVGAPLPSNITNPSIETNISKEFQNIKELTKRASKTVFICYSHQDKRWLKRLKVHLGPVERKGVIEFWDDTKIQPGEKWRDEIQQKLEAATVAVLLISPDFMNSEFILNEELPQILARAQSERITILTLIVGDCLFQDTGLDIFQSVNHEKPLNFMKSPERERTYYQLALTIKRSLDQ